MTQSFREFLTEEKIAGATIQQATRYYIAERYGDLPPSEMKDVLLEKGVDESTLSDAQRQLEDNPRILDNACLSFLSAAWETSGEEQRVRNAFAEAKNKLPVIEASILAIVGMYAMYLSVTGGKRKRSVERTADGSYKETTEYYSASGPLGTIVDLVRGHK